MAAHDRHELDWRTKSQALASLNTLRAHVKSGEDAALIEIAVESEFCNRVREFIDSASTSEEYIHPSSDGAGKFTDWVNYALSGVRNQAPLEDVRA